jgi:hypothetical protein
MCPGHDWPQLLSQPAAKSVPGEASQVCLQPELRYRVLQNNFNKMLSVMAIFYFS